MKYPGRIIKIGEEDPQVVTTLKKALNKSLTLKGDASIQLDAANPKFGPQMKQAVKLYQARHSDRNGLPLKVDGEVGSLTWESLFGAANVPSSQTATDPFLARALVIAGAEEEKGVKESPPNSNRGPEVNAYLKSVGLGPGYAWCCAFTYWCFDQAAKELNLENRMVRTAGVLAHWNSAPARGAKRIPRHIAVANPEVITPGMIFIMDFGGGLGHTGFVEAISGGMISTIEGNTNANKSRIGGGVCRLTRKIGDIHKGFIDYSD
jgi:CHAP domain/Putative peptidoglycan binding domain